MHWTKRLKRKRRNIASLTIQTLKDILLAYKNGVIPREGVFAAMQQVAESQWSLNALPPICSENELDVIGKSEAEIKTLKLRHPGKREEVLMGMVMGKLRGRIDGAMVARKIGFGNG